MPSLIFVPPSQDCQVPASRKAENGIWFCPTEEGYYKGECYLHCDQGAASVHPSKFLAEINAFLTLKKRSTRSRSKVRSGQPGQVSQVNLLSAAPYKSKLTFSHAPTALGNG